jgi:hypothetical protein
MDKLRMTGFRGIASKCVCLGGGNSGRIAAVTLQRLDSKGLPQAQSGRGAKQAVHAENAKGGAPPGGCPAAMSVARQTGSLSSAPIPILSGWK